MRLDHDDAKKFPNFKKYLESDFGHLAANEKIVNALTKAGEFQDANDAKRFIIFGSLPKIRITSAMVHGSAQFNDFPTSIPLVRNLVQFFENKDNLNVTKKVLNQAVFLTTGNGPRIFQIGLKLLELLIEGNLAVNSQSHFGSAERKKRVTAFDDEVYGGIDKSGTLFFN